MQSYRVERIEFVLRLSLVKELIQLYRYEGTMPLMISMKLNEDEEEGEKVQNVKSGSKISNKSLDHSLLEVCIKS